MEGPKCTGHMAHLTTPDGAAGPASPRSTLAALTPSLGPHPFFSAFQLLCCCMLVFPSSFPCFSVICQCFLFSGFFPTSSSLRSWTCFCLSSEGDQHSYGLAFGSSPRFAYDFSTADLMIHLGCLSSSMASQCF